MAMVIDEYEALLDCNARRCIRRVVGDITDEHDPDAHLRKIIILQPDMEWSVDATVDLDRFQDILQIDDFYVETAVTLGRFLTEHAQRLLKIGENFFYKVFALQFCKQTKKECFSTH